MTTAAGVIQEAVRVVNWTPDAKHSEQARYDALRALTNVYAFSTAVAMETLRRIDPAAAERVAQYLERVDDWACHSENAWAWHERLTKGEPIDPKGYHFPALAGQTDDPLMTDPVIPPEAVEAAANAYFGQIHEVNRARILAEFEAVLTAALPHLRPLFEVATQVGLELGRQEAAEEIARRIEACITRNAGPLFQGADSAFEGAARMAREVATRTADARTHPPGHTHGETVGVSEEDLRIAAEQAEEWTQGLDLPHLRPPTPEEAP